MDNYTEKLPVLTMTEARPVLYDYWATRQPVMIYGKPGIGKTALVKNLTVSLAEKLGKPFTLRTLYPSQLESVDVKGLPMLKKVDIKVDSSGEVVGEEVITITDWALPSFFPIEPDSHGILFIDEALTAAPSVQHAIMPLILEREINGRKMPDGWWSVGAANRKQDGCPAQTFNPALNNRFAIHFVLKPSVDEFIEHAVKQGFDFRVIAFLRSNPQAGYLNSLSKTSDFAWASARSWEFLSNVLKLEHNTTKNITELYTHIVGGIGIEVGNEFINYCQYAHLLPSIKDILKDPEKAPLPDFSKDTSIAYLLTMNLVSVCIENHKNIPACFDYLHRYAIEKAPGSSAAMKEFAMIFTKLLLQSVKAKGKNIIDLIHGYATPGSKFAAFFTESRSMISSIMS